MIIAESCYQEMIDAPARSIRARVELFDGSTLLDTFTYDGALQSFTVERTGELSKFFGFGICQKLTVNLRDKDRLINIEKGQGLEVVVGVGCEYLYTCPIFFVEEVQRDENTNNLTITAYDAIYSARSHIVSEVVVPLPYTIYGFTAACASVLGMPIKFENVQDGIFDTSYENGANLTGRETIRDVLDDIAEATGTIYYMNNNWELTFKRLDNNGNAVLTIDKSKYFTLSSKTVYDLQKITHVTELGDNITVDFNVPGAHQYIRENAFLNARTDTKKLLQTIFNGVYNTKIAQFDLNWRGNFLVEIGDCIDIIGKNDEVITVYLLNDTITYNGGLKQSTSWDYVADTSETASNPSTIGDALKKTTAIVDKINNEIVLQVKETQEAVEGMQSDLDVAISEMKLTSENITASVEQNAINVNNQIAGMEQNIELINNKVAATMTSEEVEVLISTTMSKGTSSVETSTGFTFNELGLSVTKSNSEISTTITEDGMTVYKNEEAMLTANNEGVVANNLHSNYIIISGRCRFEKYGADRAGCYWLGGE